MPQKRIRSPACTWNKENGVLVTTRKWRANGERKLLQCSTKYKNSSTGMGETQGCKEKGIDGSNKFSTIQWYWNHRENFRWALWKLELICRSASSYGNPVAKARFKTLCIDHLKQKLVLGNDAVVAILPDIYGLPREKSTTEIKEKSLNIKVKRICTWCCCGNFRTIQGSLRHSLHLAKIGCNCNFWFLCCQSHSCTENWSG